jgi:hypothetical protein
MQVVQTAGLSPNQGRTNFPMIGWTKNRRKVERRVVRA